MMEIEGNHSESGTKPQAAVNPLTEGKHGDIRSDLKYADELWTENTARTHILTHTYTHSQTHTHTCLSVCMIVHANTQTCN